MTGRLAGKVAIVVGAGAVGPGWGNGRATAVLFAREGAAVLCADLDEASAIETVQRVRSEGGVAEAIAADASSAADVDRIVATCLDRFGSVDILDNNVGVMHPEGVVDVSEADWDRSFEVNVKSFMLTMQRVIPIMVEEGGGSIVNISSIASLRSTLRSAAVAYAATKGAVNRLTEVVAHEVADRNIRVNAVVPGLMRTPVVDAIVDEQHRRDPSVELETLYAERGERVPLGHLGDGWDVAHAALYLASDESKYVTGVCLPVDGGLRLRC